MTTRAITLWALGALATAGLALGGPPKAAPDVLRWRPTYEEALRESQLRNVPILVSRHKDTWGRCVRMYRSVLENKDFVRWSQEGVVLLVAHNELGHEEKQETDSYGNAVKRCTLYPGLACADHLNAAVDIDNARADGLVKVPFVELCPNTWLVSPTGEVSRVSEEEQFVPGKIRERVEVLRKSLGAAVPRKDFAALADDAAKADTAIEESRYRDALMRLSALGKALKTPHAALETFIGARLASIDKYVTYDFEDVRDKPTLAAADKRDQIQVLLEVVDVEVLGARLACHAAMKAWLAPK